MTELTEEKRREISENFDFFDTDHNGHIDFDEFAKLLRILSPDCTVQQTAEGFSIIDTNSDGFIDLEEFIEWWQTTWWEY